MTGKKEKKVFTTKEVGDFCGVDLTTVINWADQGKLKVYRTPGGHRRIKKKELRKFMEKYSMPIPLQLRQGDKKSILVVDDDPNILVLISHALKRLSVDYELVTAADGFEAGQKVADFKPDIVILDLRLPGIDGYSVIDKIRKQNKTKILAITAYSGREDREKVLQAGANAYLSKPFTVDEFLDELNLLLK